MEIEKEALRPLAEITADNTRASEEIEMENEAQRTRAKISGDSSSVRKSDWVVELEAELMKEEETGDRTSALVFSVAKAFSILEQQFYVPSIISVGPYHFGRADLSGMEAHKTEAVRRMQKRIGGRRMQSIVETEIVAMDKSIRKFYDKELSYSAIDLAWMLTKDSCFLFEFMLNYLRTHQGAEDFHNDCVVKGTYDAVLDSSSTNPTLNTILYDVALFENQIPLSVLQQLLAIAYSNSDPEKILGDILNKTAKVHRRMVFWWGMAQPYEKQKALHFLEVLYYCHIGWDLAGYTQKAYSVKGGRVLYFGWTKSIFTRCCPAWTRERGVDSTFRLNKLPSAAELKKKGVELCAVTSTNSVTAEKFHGIRWVQFEDKTSTLYLPEVRVDLFRHALLRNFIAMERSSGKYAPYPISSFAFLMDELVDSEEDIAVLREANIIRNFFGSNKEAADCFNSLTRSYSTTYGCKPIEDVKVALNRYLGRKYKILWNEFISTYFTKPWLVAGSVAATLLLLMTMLQVFCLFYTCNRSP